ncbi:MAG TPA: phosphoribosylanthranilate isomerase [Solirubrobacteraceae bacterium]|nr:phosphoribosylanthranilate isomerase [Solirubrobacteraceae bacterium]
MVRVKHCGITSVDDAVLATEAGAWALGMIFWPGSPRRCAPDVADEIGRTLRRQVELVGVFVNASLDEIAALADVVGLSMVQLHGDEGPSFAAEVARRTGTKVIKAERIRNRADLQALQAFRNVDYHLVDAYVEGLRGGTGETVDASLIASRESEVPLVLSGGLTAANVAESIRVVAPFAVDVASGTEAAPGVKDPAKIAAFAEAVAEFDEPEPASEPDSAIEASEV